ncbi:MAG: DNA repair protein RecN [Prevotellaceae bacterium]|nr:DNA repair protein RecN [Prevotella sp.]MCI7045809.1 DNA repair protein RecN [Prevotella sp.]MDD6817410.1 DNA repair protein RecN [Prevotellaceae bacterium]
MLTQLYISNFALIDKLDIQLYPGFSVITGETGAGKSIILGAIALLLGQRADTKVIKPGEKKCVIEAHFNLSQYDFKVYFEDNDIDYDDECIIRRELTANGKSRAFVNDQPVALTMLKELGEQLVDVHSQHQNLLLNKHDFQLNVIDIIANNKDLIQQYTLLFNEWKQKVSVYDNLRNQIEKNLQNADFLRYQWEELNNAQLNDADEQETLEMEENTLSHSEEIKNALYETTHLLDSTNSDGAIDKVRNAYASMNAITDMMAGVDSIAERLQSCYIELKDISEETGRMMDKTDFDPNRLQFIQDRLSTIYSLQKKYAATDIASLIDKREMLAAAINNIDNSDEALANAQKEMDKAKDKAIAKAKQLSSCRQKAAEKVQKNMVSRLAMLGMPNVRFEISIDHTEMSIAGIDKVAFLFSANKSMPLQPISQVASGGEIARVMLSLKAMISGAVKLPTIVFDEIDTGVSGKMAECMALTMKEMGDSNRQVISITHLPQIAAMGSHHYKVTKTDNSDTTTTSMTELDEGQRVREIAQMLSGSDITEAAMCNARELLNK